VLPADIERFARLGVVASMQPPHPPGTMGLPLEPTISLIGEERWPYSYAWQTLREAGARLAFGSDWPVSDINPMRGIHAAVTRNTWKKGLPEQRQSLAETLSGYTSDGGLDGVHGRPQGSDRSRHARRHRRALGRHRSRGS